MKIKLLLPLVLVLLIEVGHAHERENPEPFFEKVERWYVDGSNISRLGDHNNTFEKMRGAYLGRCYKSTEPSIAVNSLLDLYTTTMSGHHGPIAENVQRIVEVGDPTEAGDIFDYLKHNGSSYLRNLEIRLRSYQEQFSPVHLYRETISSDIGPYKYVIRGGSVSSSYYLVVGITKDVSTESDDSKDDLFAACYYFRKLFNGRWH